MGITTPPDSPNAVAQFLREHSLQYEGKFSKIYQYIGVVTGEIYQQSRTLYLSGLKIFNGLWIGF